MECQLSTHWWLVTGGLNAPRFTSDSKTDRKNPGEVRSFHGLSPRRTSARVAARKGAGGRSSPRHLDALAMGGREHMEQTRQRNHLIEHVTNAFAYYFKAYIFSCFTSMNYLEQSKL